MALDFDTLFWGGSLTIAGPLAFAHGFRLWRRRRLIQDTPTARVRSMAMGLVEVTGIAHGRSTVQAPFSGHSCVYWQVDVSVPARRGQWRVIHRNSSGQPFYLDDGTGMALVFPKGAECSLRHQVEEVAQGLALPSCYSDYLREHGGAVGAMARLSPLRFRERKLEEGQQLYVLGTAVPRAREVMISDGDALAATGTDGPASLHRNRLRERDANVRGVIRQGERERTFILSQESEKSLAFGLGIHSTLLLVGGPLATVAGLWVWMDFVRRMAPHG
jgi:hypothetical protein